MCVSAYRADALFNIVMSWLRVGHGGRKDRSGDPEWSVIRLREEKKGLIYVS